jgi:hypothetical protein
MTLRINLLRNDELRQAGALTHAFVMRVTLAIVIAVVVVGTGLIVLNMRNARKHMEQSRERFRQIDPLYQDIRAMQQDLTANRSLVEELGAWEHSRVLWSEALMDLQKVVPEAVQLSRFTIAGGFTVITGEKWENVDPVPARVFDMRINGQISGDFADAVVIQFLRDLKGAPGLEDIIKAVELQRGLQRQGNRGGEGETRWVFAIEVEGKERKME